MLQLIRNVSYAAPLAVWFFVCEWLGIQGPSRFWVLTWALAAGVVLGYWVVPYGIDHGIAWPRTIFFVCLFLIPESYYCFIKQGSRFGTEGQRNALNTDAEVTSPVIMTSDAREMALRESASAKATGEQEGEIRGIDRGREQGIKEAYEQPTLIEMQRRANPCIVRNDKYNTVVVFTKPGCSPIIDTKLSTNPGNAYFVSTNGVIKGLRVGTLKNGGNPSVMRVMPEDLNRNEGFPLWGTEVSCGRTMSLITDAVPNGTYQINIRQSAFSLQLGETAPGEYTDKPLVYSPSRE